MGLLLMAKTRNMQQIVLRIALGLRGQAIQAGYPQSILATLKTWDHCLIGKTIAIGKSVGCSLSGTLLEHKGKKG